MKLICAKDEMESEESECIAIAVGTLEHGAFRIVDLPVECMDKHQALKSHGLLDLMEGIYTPEIGKESMTEGEIFTVLAKHGFIYDQEFNEWLNESLED